MKKIIIMAITMIALSTSAQEQFKSLYDSKTEQTTELNSTIYLDKSGEFRVTIGKETYNFWLTSDIIIRGSDGKEYYCFALEDKKKQVKVVMYEYFDKEEGVVIFFSANYYVKLLKD